MSLPRYKNIQVNNCSSRHGIPKQLQSKCQAFFEVHFRREIGRKLDRGRGLKMWFGKHSCQLNRLTKEVINVEILFADARTHIHFPHEQGGTSLDFLFQEASDCFRFRVDYSLLFFDSLLLLLKIFLVFVELGSELLLLCRQRNVRHF